MEDSLLSATSSLVTEIKKMYPDWHQLDQLRNTPQRLARMYREFCWPNEKIWKEIEKHTHKFKNTYDHMLVERGIRVYALCPHHFLPVRMTVFIGYVPDGWVLGVSKFARIADVLARRPIMQEEYSTELADMLMERLTPKGVAVYIIGSHGCMTSRGVRQSAEVVTSTIRGCFKDEAATREEFFAICRAGNGH